MKDGFIESILDGKEPMPGPTKKGRASWAVEITDPVKFYGWCLLSEPHMAYVQPNMTELNKAARQQKGAFNVPGCRAYEKGKE